MKRQKQFGFTLIEMLIAVTIVGIIMAVAYPSYVDTVRKTNRSEAQAELMDFAQRLQRCYTAYASFIESPNDSCTVYNDLITGHDVESRGGGYYRIQFVGDPTDVAYTLVAIAIKDPQLDDKMGDDEDCTEMTLSSVGVKAPDYCWNKKLQQ